jgi:GT2 family glycosyltransferase
MIYAVIVNYNSLTEAERIAKLLREECNVIHIDNEDNRYGSYAAAANYGIREAFDKGATHVLLINYDVEITPRFLDILEGVNLDIAAPLIYYDSQRELVWSSGGAVDFARGRIYHPDIRKKTITAWPREWFSFCCVLIKREVFEKIGYLDERFGFTGEDVDFCFRARAFGFKIGLVPNAVIYHKVPVHPKERLWRIDLWKLRNRINGNYLFLKRWAKWYHWLTIPIFMGAKMIKLLFGRIEP